MPAAGVSEALQRLRLLKAARTGKRKDEKGKWNTSKQAQQNGPSSDPPMDSATSMENIKRAKLDHQPLKIHPEQQSDREKNLLPGDRESEKCEGRNSETKKCEGEKSEMKTCEGEKSEMKKCEGLAVVQDVVQDLRECKEAIDEKLRMALARIGGEPHLQEMEGSNQEVCQDSASQVIGGPAEENNRKRPRENTDNGEPREKSTYGQRPRNLFVGERPCRIDVSTVSSRMIITGIQRGRNKMHKETYVYGNYPSYYYIRLDDNRIEAFEEEWFYGRDCLDVGCHEGKFTLQIVKKFRPKSMIGIDIDKSLALTLGRSNLKKDLSQLPSEDPDESVEERRQETIRALHNTRFFVGDYAAKEGAPECMDTITCFSVIKWIHFHHGDEGVTFVFRKIFTALRPGGLFIFEPQEWESYKKAKRKQNMKGVPFYDLTLLKLRPAQFLDHLVNDVGFEHVKSLAFPDALKGFCRPIFVVRKPKT